MPGLRSDFIGTKNGSRIAVREGGHGPRSLFAIGGMAPSSFCDSAIGPVLEAAVARGVHVVSMDIAGSGQSTAGYGRFTMDDWLADVEEVFARRVGDGTAIATGASIGAWLMLLAHRRHRDWFGAMCALAPALDWDQQYVAPRLRDGELSVIDGTVVNPDATAVATRELLVSMAPHHLMREPFQLAAPLHVIAGLRDNVAPVASTRRFIETARGAPCTGEIIPEGDHGVSKLDPPLARARYHAWLQAQLAARSTTAPPLSAPAGPRSGR